MNYIRDITTPITQALLAENMNFAIALPIDTTRTLKFEMFFFRVSRTFPLVKVLNSELPTINPGSISDFNYVGTIALGTGDDIFEISEEYPWRVYHFGLGVVPSYIKVYRAIPSGYVSMGWARKVPSRVGDEYDYFDGYLSPFDNPTVASETVIFRKLSFTIGLKNDSSIAVRPSIKILGKAYEVMPITNRDLIELMISGKIPFRPITVGGLRRFEYNVPEDWLGKSIVLDQATFESIMSRIWGR